MSPTFKPNDLAIPDPTAIPLPKLSIDPNDNSGTIIKGNFLISTSV